MTEREKVIHGLVACGCPDGVPDICGIMECPYKHPGECIHQLARDALSLLKEQELEIKGLRQLVEWAVECDFGYDNLGNWWTDRFKGEIEGMGYTEGLIHLAKRYMEIFGEEDDDG